MKHSAFKHYDLSQATRQSLTVSRFGGVDKTNDKFLVSDHRAIDSLNYIYKNGYICKRNGLEEKYKINEFHYINKPFNNIDGSNEVLSNTTNFNGIWKFVAEDGQEHIIAHVGKILFEVLNIESSNIELSPIASKTVEGEDGLYYHQCYEFLDQKSNAFVGGNKLWFLGGNKYMCLRFLSDGSGNTITYFFEVEDSEFTPIPITTTSIVYKNSIASGRLSLDKVNLMTQWRKNKLLSGTTKDEDENTKVSFYDYTLDAPLICKNGRKDMANFSISIEEMGVITDE